MVVSLIQILSQYGTNTVAQIRNNLATTGTNATGRTAQSLRYEVKNEGFKQSLTIFGRKYFMTVETGRKPTPQYDKPSAQFVASIKQWADTKGIGKFAYAIAKSIHQKGTKLYQTGGRQDVVSNVVNAGLIEQMTQDVLSKFADEYLKNSVKIVTNNN